MSTPDSATVTAEILRQAAARGRSGSLCPSEVARALAPGGEAWRRLLGIVRTNAFRLAKEGRLEVLRKGKPVDVQQEVRGVIRLRIVEDAP
jgi:hypothetical protein